jgi:hypothetical protein
MRGLLLAAVLLAQARLADGVFGDGVESPWDDDYHLQPGWAATVEAYRQREYAKREIHLHEAQDDAVRIATWMAISIAFIFVSGTVVVWTVNSKEAAALHDYVQSHHQTADDIDEMTGAKEKLQARYESRERAGLGVANKTSEVVGLDYMARVDGRFGHADHVSTGAASETLEQKLRKKQAREAHVLSLVERAFAAVDTDGSGELTRDELRDLLKRMHQPHDERALDTAMDEFDPDNSGTVSFEEFKASWVSRYDDDASAAADTIARGATKAASEGGGRTVKASQIGRA